MTKRFIKIKEDQIFSSALKDLTDSLIAMGIPRKYRNRIKVKIFAFINKTKTSIAEVTDKEIYKNDLLKEISEMFGTKARMVSAAVPAYVLNKMVEEWKDNLENRDSYWEDNWIALREILDDVSWLSDFKKYNRKEIRLYKAYLKDWYPWDMSEQEKTLKEEDIQSLLVKYLSKITDEAIAIDYYNPENGG